MLLILFLTLASLAQAQTYRITGSIGLADTAPIPEPTPTPSPLRGGNRLHPRLVAIWIYRDSKRRSRITSMT